MHKNIEKKKLRKKSKFRWKIDNSDDVRDFFGNCADAYVAYCSVL